LTEDYSIEFTEKAQRQLSEIDSPKRIHEALDPVYLMLRINPRTFGIVPPLGNLYFAKSRFYLGDGFTVPSITLFFTILEDDKIVRIVGARQNPGFGDLE
jgi:hypothetical protein